MSNYDTQKIVNVLNYNENEIFVDSARDSYKFSASRDGKVPSIVPMTISELQYINSNTEVIMSGWLTFDKDEKEDIFKALRIADYEDILTNEDIEEILIHPTLDGLQKIINIETSTYFDRVRIAMFKLMNNGVDVTTKVSRIVEQRYNELRNKQRKSSIILTKKDTKAYASPDDVKELSAQNEALKAQMDEMKKMMEQMMLSKNSTDKVEDVETVPEIKESPTPKAKTTTRKRTTKAKQTT